jgi:hypothetical protein
LWNYNLEVAMVLALNDFGEPDLGGWWIGLIIGFDIVLVVVIIVGALLALASRIAGQVRTSVGLLDVTRTRTESLAELGRANQTLRSILSGARAAREALGG